jgi:hypothetical protein
MASTMDFLFAVLITMGREAVSALVDTVVVVRDVLHSLVGSMDLVLALEGLVLAEEMIVLGLVFSALLESLLLLVFIVAVVVVVVEAVFVIVVAFRAEADLVFISLPVYCPLAMANCGGTL